MSSGSDRVLSGEDPTWGARKSLSLTPSTSGTLGQLEATRARRVQASDTRLALSRFPVACDGLGDLFGSTDLIEHHEAAQLCAPCPGRQLCLRLAQLETYADGTYGGVLFVNGDRRTA